MVKWFFVCLEIEKNPADSISTYYAKNKLTVSIIIAGAVVCCAVYEICTLPEEQQSTFLTKLKKNFYIHCGFLDFSPIEKSLKEHW